MISVRSIVEKNKSATSKRIRDDIDMAPAPKRLRAMPTALPALGVVTEAVNYIWGSVLNFITTRGNERYVSDIIEERVVQSGAPEEGAVEVSASGSLPHECAGLGQAAICAAVISAECVASSANELKYPVIKDKVSVWRIIIC